MASTEVGRYQMLWDCPGCGTKGLLGLDHRHCPNCGAPQDPKARYFPDEAQKVAVEDHPYHGADRACPACDTPNAAIASHCVSCGSFLDAAKAVARRAEQAAQAPDSAAAAQAEHEARRTTERQAAMAAANPGRRSGLPRWVWGLLVVVGLVGVLGCGALLFETCAPRETTATVTGHTWARAVLVEELRAVNEQAWQDQVPAGARGVSCHRAQRDTRRVADGQDCSTRRVDNGDGTFSEVQDCVTRYRQEPVYDQRCSYTIDRWVTADTLRAGGQALTPEPAWPATPAPTPTRRLGARTETYTVTFTVEGEGTDTCELAQDRWATMAVGSRWRAEVGGLSGDLRCDDLAPR